MKLKTIGAALALTAIAAAPALAQDPVKIGLITTLSGPAGYLGNQILDGFKLAVDDPGAAGLGDLPDLGPLDAVEGAELVRRDHASCAPFTGC